MKKNLIISIIVLVLPFFTLAQSAFLEKARNRAKNKVENRALNKIDKEIDKGLDEIENPSSTKPDPKQPAVQKSGEKEAEADEIKAYSKYDFVPGEKIIYAEDFAQDEIGELPLNWNTGGKAELVTLDAFEGKWLRLFQNAVYLTSNTDSFSRNFTVEFDLIMDLKNNGYSFPYISFGLLASDSKPANDNSFLEQPSTYQSAQVFIRPSAGGASGIYTETQVHKARHFLSENQNLAAIEKHYGKVSHISITIQGSRFRIWINGEKKYDLPMAIPTAYTFNQVFFKLHSSSYKDDQLGIYLSNIKVASGKADTRKKLLEEGKFSTTGILFDNNKADIQPGSYGVVREIANALKQETSIRIKVVGHTSSDGDDQSNLQLSKKRSAAVKQMLVTEFGIDEARIETEGMGETQPAADNKTSEGKTQNRRVEFIKI